MNEEWMPMVLKSLVIVVAALFWAGCAPAERDGIDTPGAGRTVSVQWLKERYRGRPLDIADDVSLRVRVASTDAEGQFRRSLWVQDASGAIELKIALAPSHERYPQGQWMAVRCAGLVLGTYGGTLQLGAAARDGRYEVGFIAEDDLARHLVVYGLPVEKPAPAVLTPRDFSMRWTGCLVRVAGVEFVAEEAGLTWGAPKAYATRHTITTAAAGRTADTLSVRTSPDAAFAGRVLPRGEVTLTGILTHFAGRYELVVIHPPE